MLKAFKSGGLPPLFLFILCVLIWGSTWIVIHFQTEAATPIVSASYRFFLASGILFAIGRWTRTRLRWDRKQHLWFVSQGLANFCLNYILTYTATMMAPSGLVSLTFMTLIYFNMAGLAIFFGARIGWNVIAGSFLGAAGLVAVFLNEITAFEANPRTLTGLAVGLGATFFASIGNLFAYRNLKQGVPVVASNAWGMLYGAISSALIALALGHSFGVVVSDKFVFSLLYLTIFGTVIAFNAYMSLVDKIGADRAAYTSVMCPVIALSLSALFENFRWSWMIGVGFTLCALGNVLVLGSPARTQRASSKR